MASYPPHLHSHLATHRSGSYTLRLATAADLALLEHIEREAAALFPPAALANGPAQATLPLQVLIEGVNASLLWVAALSGSDEPVGFLLARVEGGALHIAEMDVHPAYGRRGIGAALLGIAYAAAADRGLQHLTLTTFEQFAWNGPFYERQGFRRVTDVAAFVQLAETLRQEAAAGWAGRIGMAKQVR